MGKLDKTNTITDEVMLEQMSLKNVSEGLFMQKLEEILVELKKLNAKP